jgi:signal transduction histidine kinase
MRISTRFRLAGLFSAAIVAIVIVLLLVAAHKEAQELARDEATGQILEAVNDLRYLALEYELRHEARAQAQWRTRHASFSRLLAGMTVFQGTPGQEIIDGLGDALASVESLFTQLVANQQDRAADKEKGTVLEELEARLSGQLLNRVQVMISATQSLGERSQTSVRAAQQQELVLEVLCASLATLAIGVALFLTVRSVTRPLAKLHEGTGIIGAGNLDFRLDVATRDELGELARAFDAMTGKLKGTTVSRDELARVNAELQSELSGRQRAEAGLNRHAAELQRTNRDLELSNLDLQRFAHVASHDLQTPLRSIGGFLQLLQSEYEGRLDPRADDWIRRTVQATKVLQASIRDLLEYSRIDSMAHPFERVSFEAIFADAVLLLDAAIQESAAEVTRDELPTLMGDRTQLVRLMQNLIANSLTYCVGPPRVHVSAQSTASEWVFSVRDNGIGIEPKYHERIFDIFQRLHTQQEYSGTGIGLAVCRRIVHRHSGRIWLESRPDRGTTFFFTIPADKV